MSSTYDVIGVDYHLKRHSDPRLKTQIYRSIESGSAILNVGAGTGSYEDPRYPLVALEPSLRMIEQRPVNSAPAVRGAAETLPFRDKTFDVGLALLTVHHWADFERAALELKRVLRKKIVFLTWDPEVSPFWLVRDYFPEIFRKDQTLFPKMEDFRKFFPRCSIENVEIPDDCIDGFLGAHWKRPEEYLRPSTRQCISAFQRLQNFDRGLEALRCDLENDQWYERNRELMPLQSLDVGYRIVICEIF
ncbi:MAG: methyltransferase domain-containing protein [Bdellovibrionales bacterium]|nr:methyltransferase domain-containing protein [Bdellovibrionales bacterium]